MPFPKTLKTSISMLWPSSAANAAPDCSFSKVPVSSHNRFIVNLQLIQLSHVVTLNSKYSIFLHYISLLRCSLLFYYIWTLWNIFLFPTPSNMMVSLGTLDIPSLRVRVTFSHCKPMCFLIWKMLLDRFIIFFFQATKTEWQNWSQSTDSKPLRVVEVFNVSNFR